MTTSPNKMSDEEYEEHCYPSDKFADVAFAKAIKKILHPKGFDILYPETEDELGNPKIQAIMELAKQHREAYAIEQRIKEVEYSVSQFESSEEYAVRRVAELREKVGRDHNKL